MYDNLQEKYKNVSQILKICKIRTLERLAILILIQQLGKVSVSCAIRLEKR